MNANNNIVIPTVNFDGICEEMFEDFIRGIHNMPEEEKEKTHEILRGMSQN